MMIANFTWFNKVNLKLELTTSIYISIWGSENVIFTYILLEESKCLQIEFYQELETDTCWICIYPNNTTLTVGLYYL